MRLHSREHPGFFLGWMKSERHRALLRGLPHALLLLNEAGEAHVLLSGLCKPCRLTDPADPLQTQLLLARHSRGWADALTGVRHYPTLTLTQTLTQTLTLTLTLALT